MKKFVAVTALLCALTLSMWAGSQAHAEDEAAPKPHVYTPYSKLNLTADQQEKIGRIQVEIRARIKALMAEEETKVHELLDDVQKTELKKMDEVAAEKRRAYAKKYREKKQAEAEEAEAKK